MTAPDLRRVEYVPLDEVTPAPRNPRQHEMTGLRVSIQRFGFVSPALRDERTGRLVVGHGRTQALRQMRDDGDTPPAGVRLDGGRWLIPVVCGWSSRSDVEAEAYLLADNRYTELGGWDDADLAAMLADIGEVDAELLAATGFTEDDLAELLAEDADGGRQGRTDPDDVPEPPEETVTRPGDVWLLGPHKLACWDSTAADMAERLGLTDGVDLILTDPPYCSGGFQESGRVNGSVGRRGAPRQVANDLLSTRGYVALMKAVLAALPARYAYVCTDWRMWVTLFDVVESVGYGVRSMVVWDKGSPGMGRGWRSQHELVMWAAKETPPFDKHAAAQGNVVQVPRASNDLHTTQKPVALLDTLLETVPFAGSVYDPFAGSGSTLIAANRAGRVAYLGELDPLYCDVALRRYQAHTGDLPILEATGEPHDFTPELSTDPALATT